MLLDMQYSTIYISQLWSNIYNKNLALKNILSLIDNNYFLYNFIIDQFQTKK